MQSSVSALITAQDHDELKPIIGQIVEDEITSIGEVTTTKIGRSAGSATAGIFQVTGRARTRVDETEWSVVVKALGAPDRPRAIEEEDPYRELEIYRSGVFADVAGLRSARCFAVQDRGDFQLLWLEDLSNVPQPPWKTEQFLETAHHLGQFNAYWPEQRLPRWDWLSQRGFHSHSSCL